MGEPLQNTADQLHRRGLMFILSSPSGAGKTTLSRMLLAKDPEIKLSVSATTRTTGRTGVEMEALTAATVALLTVYDMLKAVDRGMTIETVRLVAKSGGTSGDWTQA